MNSYGGNTSPTGKMLGAMADCAEVRATPLNRLENALSRLDDVTSRTIGNASQLTGGWPTGDQKQPAAPTTAGVFGAVEEIAYAIHRVCDRLDEANRAVSERLP